MTVLVALLVVATAALRGYLPGARPGPREPAADSPIAVAVVVGLLVAAVAVMAVAVIVRLRHRSPTPPRPADRLDWLRRESGKPTWRVALIAFGLILAWLLITMALGRLGGGSHGEQSDPGATPGAAHPAPAANGAAPNLPPPSPDPSANLLNYFFGATVVFLVVIVVGTLIASRRQRRSGPLVPGALPGDVAPDQENSSDSLARAAEVGLAEVGDLSRDPRRAIIACYAAMERQLELLPDAAPRDFDTASEVLARAVEHQALAPDSATQLVDLFDEARFSPHVMNEGHRDVAVAVLTEVLDELRSRA